MDITTQISKAARDHRNDPAIEQVRALVDASRPSILGGYSDGYHEGLKRALAVLETAASATAKAA